MLSHEQFMKNNKPISKFVMGKYEACSAKQRPSPIVVMVAMFPDEWF